MDNPKDLTRLSTDQPVPVTEIKLNNTAELLPHDIYVGYIAGLEVIAKPKQIPPNLPVN